MSEQENRERRARLIVGLITALSSGVAELNALTDDLIAKLRAGSDDNAAREASKAFEAVYRKSGALEAAFKSAASIEYAFRTGESSFGRHRDALSVLAGCTRESPEVVVGKAVLSSAARVDEAIAVLTELKAEARAAVTDSLNQLKTQR